MALSAKTIKKQLHLLKPLLSATSLETCRRGQNKLGELMGARQSGRVLYKEHAFADFTGAWVIPKDERRQGVLLYLHGGGYTCGDLEYAKGVAANLAVQSGTRVFCAAYRLAPEHRFPCALEDALCAYRYLLEKGYAPRHITLCGESAGGGLCYALCLKLKEEALPLPCGIIAISPWTDLTASGESYTKNREVDPSISQKVLSYYADCYCDDRQDPLVSPLFGDMTKMPPSLIFVGGDEIMLDDAALLHENLLSAGCKSELYIASERWHAYVLYDLEENRDDWQRINRFLNRTMAQENKLRWMRLDNAAKIYPAARDRNWSNVFRLSVTLTEAVDKDVLQSALDVTARRFPMIAARLRKGVFWYYLEQVADSIPISHEQSHPLARMSKKQTRQCALRVIAYKNRIAVEFFHSLTDGNGALVFLKTLTAEYLQQKYGVHIPATDGVLGRLEEPSPEELEDSFLKYAGDVSASRNEDTAWHLKGTKESNGFLHLTSFSMSASQVVKKAHEYHVTLTAFLCAAMMEAILRWQKEKVPSVRKRKPIKILIPVNLRKLFPSKSLRNFALYTTPQITSRLGEYSFEEICRVVHHTMGLEVTPKYMSTRIAKNVGDERSMLVKIMPLFIKNAVMKAVFNAVGECKSCLTLSNLGAVQLPEAMKPYVERLDFILGVQASAPHNCGVLSYGDQLIVNFIRNIKESDLESHFYRVLQEQGIDVLVESNRASRP